MKVICFLSEYLLKCLGLADRFMVLNKGKLVFDGTPSDGLKADLESWGIRNPMTSGDVKSLIWS